MESDVHPLSDANVIFKYADDTNLLVPENTFVAWPMNFLILKAVMGARTYCRYKAKAKDLSCKAKDFGGLRVEPPAESRDRVLDDQGATPHEAESFDAFAYVYNRPKTIGETGAKWALFYIF